MNNEEKILEILEKLSGTVEKHGEMLEKLNGTVEKHGEMLEKLNGTVEKHGEMLEKLSGTVEKHGEKLEQHGKMLEKLQIDVSGIKVRLDVEVKQQFNLLAEGQQIIREILIPEERVEKVETDVGALKTTVRMHSREIAQLKKA